MKVYIVNGQKRLYHEGKAPDGAILAHQPKAKAIKPVVKAEEKPEETKTKARKPRNKSRKAESDK